MNKPVYEKNIVALENKFPAWASAIKNTKRKKRNFDVIAETSLMGETILKIRENERVLYLNGKYGPSRVVERWLEGQGKIDEYATIVIIGISNGTHVKRIMESVPKSVNILVYEPSYEIFRRAVEEVDLSFLFQLDIPVGVIVEGLNENEREVFFNRFISYDNMALLKLYVSRNYPVIFTDKVGEFIKQLKKRVVGIEVNWNTVVRYTDVNALNIFHNLPYLYEGYSVEELKGILPEDIPVIVVSAGPSLNKNISELKNIKGRACIIATDTAMKPLLNAGIIPHLFVIVDGLKPANLFQHKDISKVGMVTMTGVSVEPMKIHKGKKFFYWSGSGFEGKILSELGEKERRDMRLPDLPSGGSVATSAYSLGIYMGAKVIILIGQDLAMTNNRTHADGTFQDKMDEIDITKDEYIEVESVDGGKVLTRPDFKLYLDWFERVIKEWNHITTIDATEGGALIHGSKTMTLKKAIQKYCNRDFNVKWHIAHSKRLFSEEAKEVVLDYFANSEKKLKEVKKKAKEGYKYYEQLGELADKEIISDDEIRKVLKKIKGINTYMEADYMAGTVIDSLRGIESVLRPLIYQIQEEQQKELADVAEHGKVMLYAISIAANQIAGIAHDTIVPYAEKHRRMKKE